MSSVIEGESEHTAQPSPRAGRSAVRAVIVRASKISIFPARSSPAPVTYFIASSACIDPITPAIAPITPASLQEGTAPFFGGLRKTHR